MRLRGSTKLVVFKDLEEGMEQAPSSGCPGAAQRAQKEQQEPLAGERQAHDHCSVVQGWLQQLHSSWEGSLQTAFFKLLRGSSGKQEDKTIKIVNQAREWISNIFPFTRAAATAAASSNSPLRARSCQYLYYRVLFKLLSRTLNDASDDGKRELTPKQTDEIVHAILENDELQIGLLNCCIEVVAFAYLDDRLATFPTTTIALGRLSRVLELWQGIDWLTELCGPADEAAGIPAMPECLVNYLAAMQTRIEEELAWQDGSSIFARMLALGRCTDDEENDSSAVKRRSSRRKLKPSPQDGPDGALVARFFTSLATTAMLRTTSVCCDLLRHHQQLQRVADFPNKCCTVVDMMIFEHMHLLFGQHLSVLIASSIFFTLRLHGEVLPFRKITSHMAASLPNHDEETFSQVDMPPDPSAWGTDQEPRTADTRQFYNEVFLSSMEGYTASDLFEDSTSGVSGTTASGSPSTAAAPAPQRQEASAGSGSDSEETQLAARPAARRRRTPLAPHAAAAWRRELEAPAPSSSAAASVAASGSRGRSAVAAATAAKGSAGTSVRGRGVATVKAAAALGAVRERRPLGFVDRNKR